MTRKIFVWTLLLVTLCLVVAGCGTEKPTQVVSSGFTPSAVCIVPDVVGLGAAAAEGQLVSLGLQPIKSNQYDPGVAEGAVISQDPPGGTQLEPCQGGVTIVVSLGPVPGPTAAPTKPPTPTPIPPTAAPTPDSRLFWDDFEMGVKPEWGMQGDYTTVNGKLVAGQATEGYVGDLSWTDYAVVLHGFEQWCKQLDIKLRTQDRDNYIYLRTTYGCSGISQKWEWFRVVDGQEKEIPGTRAEKWITGGGSLLRIEVEGSTYRLFLDGERLIYFNDDTFAKGGIGLLSPGEGPVTIDDLEVLPLP
jgi:hypothetical protein